MAKGGKLLKVSGAASNHAVKRLIKQCGFKGAEDEAKRFISICRDKAGKNGNLIISAKNLGLSKEKMLKWNMPDDRFYIMFVRGKAPTVCQLD
ncbi:MAG: hypothetical protein WC682_04605 [Parcubacteria group bacterium]|jgi:hypothetical protein